MSTGLYSTMAPTTDISQPGSSYSSVSSALAVAPSFKGSVLRPSSWPSPESPVISCTSITATTSSEMASSAK
ncbi:hypothetical protein D3C87_2116260 [compost metagenome]